MGHLHTRPLGERQGWNCDSTLGDDLVVLKAVVTWREVQILPGRESFILAYEKTNESFSPSPRASFFSQRTVGGVSMSMSKVCQLPSGSRGHPFSSHVALFKNLIF